MNNFQARYAIRHEWTGAIACKDPIRGRWGGPPSGMAGGGTKPALDLAFAPRGAAKLPELVKQDIPELEVKAAGPATKTDPAAGSSAGSAAVPATPEPKKKSGCGCQTDGGGGALALGGGLAVAALLVRRRRRAPDAGRRA